MKRRLLFAILLILWVASSFGEDKVLKPDREISITSVEHRDTGKPYRVEGHTSGSKTTLYYKLGCGTAAANLEVGLVYKATEGVDNGTKALVIGNVGPDGLVIICDVESVKDH